MLNSGRTIDIVHRDACKTRVLEELRKRVKGSAEILCIGDSGDWFGNDHALLAHAFGISVGTVSDLPEACWSLFGDHLKGPAALDRLLSALLPGRSGGVCFESGLAVR